MKDSVWEALGAAVVAVGGTLALFKVAHAMTDVVAAGLLVTGLLMVAGIYLAQFGGADGQ